MYQIFLKEQTNITERDSQLLTVVSSLVKYLDSLVSETQGTDSLIQVFVDQLSKIASLMPKSWQQSQLLKKKQHLVAANAYIKLQNYDQAGEHIESCCQIIQKGDKEELKIYFLAFKMHCQLGDKDQAIETFQQIFTSPQVTAEPLLECFNVLVQSNLYTVALGLGGHLMKACKKFIIEIDLKKKFFLKFLFVFDATITNKEQQAEMSDTQKLEGVI